LAHPVGPVCKAMPIWNRTKSKLFNRS